MIRGRDNPPNKQIVYITARANNKEFICLGFEGLWSIKCTFMWWKSLFNQTKSISYMNHLEMLRI